MSSHPNNYERIILLLYIVLINTKSRLHFSWAKAWRKIVKKELPCKNILFLQNHPRHRRFQDSRGWLRDLSARGMINKMQFEISVQYKFKALSDQFICKLLRHVSALCGDKTIPRLLSTLSAARITNAFTIQSTFAAPLAICIRL